MTESSGTSGAEAVEAGATPALAGDPGAEGGGQYKQELSRVLGVVGNVAITVSAITPASSVFIIIPVLLATVGSGTFMALGIAAVIGIGMAFCWAELGAAYPIAGGDYAIVSRVLGRAAGFVSFILTGPVVAVLIPAVIALGMSQYLGVVFDSDAQVMAAIVLVVSTVVAVLGIRFNAFVTGIFLACELLALLVVTILGLVNVEQPVSELFSPNIFGAEGGSTALTTSALLTGLAVAIFAYNGYANAINFVEETEGPRHHIARAILWSLGITVVFELVPTTMAILGAPSLNAFTNDASPMQYLMVELGGDGLNTVISLAVAAAILNAVIAILLEVGRIIWSSGRDNAWPGPLSRFFGAIHPRFRTPWLATLAAGLSGAALVLVTDVVTLSTWTGVSLAIAYALIALSALVSRVTQPSLERPYRMPLWPVAPLIGLTGCVIALSQQAGKDLRVALIVVAGALVYYAVYLWPRRDTHWTMLKPTEAKE